MTKQKISTIIPYFNAHNTIQASLYSILNGEADVDEVIVVNDGSSKESRKMLLAILEQVGDQRIKLFEH